jgi:Ca2+-binding RTX toxin-like protein
MATITGNNGHNELEGTRFADLIRGLGGNDEIEGRAGNDTADGGSGDDEVHGDAGNDRLLGGAGSDEVEGGSGSDQLLGGLGNDHLHGGTGNDRLWGGAGRDVFEFERGEGADRIEDFQNGLDRIDLHHFDFRSAAQALSYADQVGDDVYFAFGSGGALRLVDTSLSELGASDFVL